MLAPEEFLSGAIRPALARLRLGGAAAERLLLGTALTESGLVHLRQSGGGPARGLYQIEPATHRDLWRHYLAFRPALAARLLCLAAPAGDLHALARYWKAHFNTAAGKGRVADFLRRAGPVLTALIEEETP